MCGWYELRSLHSQHFLVFNVFRSGGYKCSFSCIKPALASSDSHSVASRKFQLHGNELTQIYYAVSLNRDKSNNSGTIRSTDKRRNLRSTYTWFCFQLVPIFIALYGMITRKKIFCILTKLSSKICSLEFLQFLIFFFA